MGRVSLTLVIGPANAEKAGHVLGGFRQALAHGRDPILVVPTLADVQHYRRELASTGPARPAVFGVEVMRFAWLMRELARRTATGGRTVRGTARERVVAVAIGRARLGPLAASAPTPGFAGALLELLDELGDVPATPRRAVAALRAWGDAQPERRAYAADVAALVSAYHQELERLGMRDERGQAAAAIDALRLAPAAWGDTPVFVYGFDDLSPLQRDALRALAQTAGADVTVSLTYEPGRAVFADRATNFEEMRSMADAVEELPARPDFYAADARDALHHLERGLFEDAAPVDPGGAIALLEAGGSRAEVELVAAHVRALLRAGWEADEIAVVFRSLEPVAPLVAHVFGAYGIPAAIDRRIPAGSTALGRGLLALLRAASGTGSAEDLLTYLRTPGVVRDAQRVDELEAHVRSEGLRTAAEARAAFAERNGWSPEAIDRVGRAMQGSPRGLCRRLAREAQGLLERPHRGAARVLDADESVDAAAVAALRTTLADLAGLSELDPDLAGSPDDLARVLAALPVRIGPSPGPGLVQVCEPLAVRARRVRALFACGLQDGVWPRQTRPRLLLTDEDRRELALASGLALRRHEDPVDAERFLFYTTASRPQERLYLSRRVVDEDGEETPGSPFLDDVEALFDPSLRDTVVRRALGAVAWEPDLAPTAREARRGEALATERVRPAPAAGLTAAPVLDRLAAIERFSATSLEVWHSCPVRWLVEHEIRPLDLEPDPEPMLRGTVAHDVLRDVLEARRSDGPLAEGELPALTAAMRRALAVRSQEVRISVSPERLRAHLHRLEADLLRYLEHATGSGSVFAPARLEQQFEVDLGGLPLGGRIDRIDTHDGEALVYDYKGSTVEPGASWLAKRRLQMALYVLAARALFEEEPVGGLYQPLGNRNETRPRGLIVADRDPDQALVDNDRVEAEEFERVLGEVLAAATAAAAQMRAGQLAGRPGTCGYRDGSCQYPSICRCLA